MACAGVGLVAAAPKDTKHALGKRATTTYCSASNLEALDFAIAELKEMLSVTISRTSSLKAFLSNPGNLKDQDVLLQSTFHTFESIFGQLFYGVKDERNTAAMARVNKIGNFATRMWRGLQAIGTNQNLEVYCSDYWLMPWSVDGTQASEPYYYYDHRTTTPRHYGYDYSTSKGICRDDTSAHYAWVIPYMPKGEDDLTSVLTLCDNWVTTWTLAYQSGDSFASIAGTTFRSGEKHLDQFQASTFTSALAHELSHAPAVVDEPYMADEHCDANGSSGAAYGWNCITHLANTSPGSAINNADSFAYFVTAMYLQANDWSTGVSMPLA